jgi:U3 small nucleolar RNA-associated protein 19
MPNAPNQPTKATYIAQISSLESSLLADLSDPNPLLPLLALARNESAEVVHKAVWALHRVFIPLMFKGSVGGLMHANLEQNVAEGAGSGDVEGGESRAVKAWVRERLVEYIRVLGGLLRDREAALRVSILCAYQSADQDAES